ncbi:hypothetical protein [Haloarcula nitratireducens]|uniref:Uncharacterized protein n=1 Tax=Haloarcula nitratireducens TaxID=2487749 RepID=A0AAW4PFR7_9EURY|nr:hypothetical protein [Halomicroarcula nitratireducens]MBX0296503.1 hypothetical protein [Halomicroarcula nitratireducens]
MSATTNPEITANESTSSGVTVQVHPRQEFESAAFRDSIDQFKDVLVLPTTTFASVFGPDVEAGYASISSPQTREDVPVYTLPFADEYDPPTTAIPKAYLRGSLREQVTTDDARPEVSITAVNTADSGPLAVTRFSTKTESTQPTTCRLHPDDLASINSSDGDSVELYNPDTGARFQATARKAPINMEPGQISVSTRCRKLLDVEFPERAAADQTTTLHVRRPVRTVEGSEEQGLCSRVMDRLLNWAVDYHEVQLRLNIGLNADEGRSAGRVNADTMDILAINGGDRVRIRSKTTETPVRCRPIDPESHFVETDSDIDAADVRDRTILLPSTARERLDAVCGDIVRVRRDTRHVAIRSITPSMFAFLGVIIGGLEIVDLLSPSLQPYGLVLTLFFAGVAIWLMLWPERVRCR